MAFLGWLSDLLKGHSDLHLVDKKVTLNHLVVDAVSLLNQTTSRIKAISWVWMVWPLPSNSDHQDYYIFSREPYKPLFATVTGKRPHPSYKRFAERISCLGHLVTFEY